MTPTFDLAAFIAFCRSKPVGKAYDWLNPNRCALAQFGFPGEFGSRYSKVPLPVFLAAVADRPTRWGALADRLSRLSENSDG